MWFEIEMYGKSKDELLTKDEINKLESDDDFVREICRLLWSNLEGNEYDKHGYVEKFSPAAKEVLKDTIIKLSTLVTEPEPKENKRFACHFTGEKFETNEECMIHEYEHSPEHKQFIDTLDLFIEEVQKRFDLYVDVDRMRVFDEYRKSVNEGLYKYRYIKFYFIKNVSKRFEKDWTLTEVTFKKTSDPFNNEDWVWNENTVEELIEDFKNRHNL